MQEALDACGDKDSAYQYKGQRKVRLMTGTNYVAPAVDTLEFDVTKDTADAVLFNIQAEAEHAEVDEDARVEH